MKKETVLTDYSHQQDQVLDNLAQSAHDKLETSTEFTLEATVLPRLQAKITNYRVKLDKSKNGNSTDIAEKNAAKKELANELKEVAIEVNRQAGGDLVKLKASGLILAKPPGPVGIIGKPTGFVVKTGKNSGELCLIVEPNKDAVMYYFYTAPVPAPANLAEWRLSPSTKSRLNLGGFIPGQQYECKCAYKGTAEELVYSDSIFIYAQ